MSTSTQLDAVAPRNTEDRVYNRAIAAVVTAAILMAIAAVALYYAIITPALARGWGVALVGLGVLCALLAMISVAAFAICLHVIKYHLPESRQR